MNNLKSYPMKNMCIQYYIGNLKAFNIFFFFFQIIIKTENLDYFQLSNIVIHDFNYLNIIMTSEIIMFLKNFFIYIYI